MTLVGVVDADLGLANGDPRAAERTFQLLSQVTGRAGRTGKKSLGLLQTYQPDHPVMRAIVSGDAESFYEKRDRRAARRPRLPPFGRLAGIIVSAADARRSGGACARAAPRGARGRRPARAWSGRGAAGADRRAPSLPAAGAGRAALGHPGVSSATMLAAGPKLRGSVRVQRRHRPAEFLVSSAGSMRRSKSSTARGFGVVPFRLLSPEHRCMEGDMMDVRSFRGRSRKANGWRGRSAPSPSCSGLILLFAPRIALRILRLQTVPEHPEAASEARATMAGFYLGLGLCCILLAQPCSTWRSASPGCSRPLAVWCR